MCRTSNITKITLQNTDLIVITAVVCTYRLILLDYTTSVLKHSVRWYAHVCRTSNITKITLQNTDLILITAVVCTYRLILLDYTTSVLKHSVRSVSYTHLDVYKRKV